MKFTLTIVCRDKITTWSELRSALITTMNKVIPREGDLEQEDEGNVVSHLITNGETLLRVGRWSLRFEEDGE